MVEFIVHDDTAISVDQTDTNIHNRRVIVAVAEVCTADAEQKKNKI